MGGRYRGVGVSITIAFTYDKVTPESAEQGDVSERGFYGFGGWYFDAESDAVKADLIANPDLYWVPWEIGALKEAIKDARGLGCGEVSLQYDGVSAYSVDWDTDYQTCEVTQYCFHVSGVTRSTAKRIARLLR